MRNALEEYKIEIEKARREVEKSKTDDKLFPDYTLEEKRVSVPRKEAVDDSRDISEADNNIKCTTSEECHEQNYKIPEDVLNNYFINLGKRKIVKGDPKIFIKLFQNAQPFRGLATMSLPSLDTMDMFLRLPVTFIKCVCYV